MTKNANKIDKKLYKLIGKTLNEQSAIYATAINLVEAQRLAKHTSNIEAYLAISDRWLQMSEVLGIDKNEKNGNIGFTLDYELSNENETGKHAKRNNKGKSKS
jgi:hypothetical protein